MENKKYNCICNICSKSFTSEDEEMTICDKCWEKILDNWKKILDNKNNGVVDN